MALNDTYQVTIWTQHLSQAGLMILHLVQLKEADQPSSDTDVAKALMQFYGPAVIALLSEHAHYQGVAVKRVQPPLPGPTVYASAGNVFGQVQGDILSTQTSGLITLRTGSPGRAGRGRKYMPFPSEHDNDIQGVPTAPYVISLRALADLFAGTVTVTAALPITGTYQFGNVIYHRSTGTKTPVVSAQARESWATQRRRGSFGRPNISPF